MPPHALEELVLVEPSAKVASDHGHSRRLTGTFSSFFDALRCRSTDAKPNAIKRMERLPDKELREPNLRSQTFQEDGIKELNFLRYKPAEEATDSQNVLEDHHVKANVSYSSQNDAKTTSIPLNDENCSQLIEQYKMEGVKVMDDEQKQPQEAEKRLNTVKQFQSVVKELSSEILLDQRKAAMDVKRIARGDAKARLTLATLGAIPPLVGMLDSASCSLQCLALQALLTLAASTNVNKSAIVDAGAVAKLVNLLSTSSSLIKESVMAALLSLSALDANKLVMGISGAIPRLIDILQQENLQARKDALRTLYNLSICPGNISVILDAKAVDILLEVLYEPPLSEKALGILGNLTATDQGRLAIMQNKEALPVLIDVLSWADSSKCQERAVYVLMVLSHHSWSYRHALASMGAVSVLLELVLMGSSLSQRRAARILESLRNSKQDSRSVKSSHKPEKLHAKLSNLDSRYEEVSEERKLVNQMVQESLQKTTDRIFKRACPQTVVEESMLP